MRVSYQHANVGNGNESSLLRFTAESGTQACVLVDSGDGVDVESLLGEDEYLTAILLTHAHIDHYETLAKNIKHSAPVYTSPATATVLQRALPEAQKDNELGNVDTALEAIEPITEWTSILNTVEVRPVPAGHTPGAAGFLIRFRDESEPTQLLDNEQHILATGDFTTRPCAGFSGLETDYPFEIDAVLLTVANSDSPTTVYNESLRTTLERAYAGSRVVVAAGSLTGVHYAALVGTAAEALDRQCPITVVGQAAKLYTALEMDVPGVETRNVFESTADVLEQGGVTIAGPSAPTKGSSGRLFRAIKDDPAGVFVQLSADDAGDVSNGQCTTYTYEFSNHPDIDTIDEVVKRLAPKEVVVKHAGGYTLNQFQRRFDSCFTWGTNDSAIHRLYDDGTWQSPGWISDPAASNIRRNQWDAVREQTVRADTDLPSLGRGTIDLEAEGVDLDALEQGFSRDAPNPYLTSPPGEPTVCHYTDIDDEKSDLRSNLGEDAYTECDAESVHSFEDELRRRLDDIEAQLDRRERTVLARVLDGGDETQFLQLLESTDIDPGEVVEIEISSRK